MSDDWTFHERDENELSFWIMQWGNDEDSMLVIWPDVRETGLITFSYGHTYDDNGYYEFDYVGWAKSLDEAKCACEAWGQKYNNQPPNAFSHTATNLEVKLGA